MAANAANNMYRVGDYVYFETSSQSPYQIRRIEELVKTSNGNVEAKVMCFYRRRDIPSNLIQLADKHQSALEEEQETETEQLTEKQRHQLKHRELFLSRQIETHPATHIRGKCCVTLLNETESLSSYLKQEDTFFYTLVYDPQQKTLLADRGEIRVGSRFQAEVPTKPLDEGEEDGRDVSNMEVLEYDPESNPLDEAQIEQYLTVAKSVGTFARALDHSSSIKQPSLHMSAATACRDVTIAHAMKTLHACNYDIGKAVLALVPSSGPVLCRDEMEDWSASEANLFEEAVEKYGKDFGDIRQDFLPWKTMKNLVEYYYMWKTTDRYVQQKRVKAVEAESKLKQVFVPNFNAKTAGLTNGCGPGAITPVLDGPLVSSNGRPCECCNKSSSSAWYRWGSDQVSSRLCQSCWSYWKKFGGLKYMRGDDKVMAAAAIPGMNLSTNGVTPLGVANRMQEGDGVYSCRECNKVFNRQERLLAHMASSHKGIHRCNFPSCGKDFKVKAHLARHLAQSHGIAMRSGSPRPIMKTRAAFYLHTNEATKVARRTCGHIFRPRHYARKPFTTINATLIKQECATRFASGPAPELPPIKTVLRGKVVTVAHKLGTPEQECPEWLVAADKDQLPQPERLAFTPPPRGEDGKFILPHPKQEPMEVDPIESNNITSPHNRNVWGINPNNTSSLAKKRTLENNNQTNGVDGPSSKRRQLAPTGLISSKSHELYGISGKGIGVSNGKPKVATITRVGGGRKQMISWVDAPDDVFFIATDLTRRVRRQLPANELRRGARKPWRRVGGKVGHNLNNNHHHHSSNNNTSGTNNLLHTNGTQRAVDLGQLA